MRRSLRSEYALDTVVSFNLEQALHEKGREEDMEGSRSIV